MLKNRDASAGDQPRGKATYGAKAKTATQDKENCMQAPSLMDDHRAQTPLEALEEVKLSANSGGNREIGQAANATKTQIKSANKRPIIDTIQAQANLIETLQARMEAMEEQVRACKESTDRERRSVDALSKEVDFYRKQQEQKLAAGQQELTSLT